MPPNTRLTADTSRSPFEQEGDEAVLRVRDTGVGIAPELLPHIFDLFTQAERSLDRSQGGLGIGLCLVQRLVEMHGGRVEVHSALGQGSEFVVRLPVMETPGSAAADRPIDATSSEPTGPSPCECWWWMTTWMRLSRWDCCWKRQGMMFGRLTMARPHWKSLSISGRTWCCLDIGLPGIDGFEVAKRLRQQPDLSGVVLVAMTGYGQVTDRQRSQERRVRSPSGQARQLQESAANLGDRLAKPK